MKTKYTVALGEEQHDVIVESAGTGPEYTVSMGDQSVVVDASKVGPMEYHLLEGDRGHNVLVENGSSEMTVHLDDRRISVRLLDERQAASLAHVEGGPSRGADGLVSVQAPMPGKVVKCLAALGDAVKAGQGIIVVEAMKMENELNSPVDGTVKEIRVSEGQNVDAGEDLVLIQ